MIEQFGIKNIINYLRRSRQDEEREKKTGEDTLHEQRVLMDRVLSEYGIPYSQESEIGSGDKISTRPVFQQIINDLENEKYDAIAVKEISRMGRGSYTDMGTIYDLLVEKRIFIITPWKIYDPTNPADLRQIRFELFMSREEFETTRERLNGGRYNAAIEGKWVSGAAPFGYDYNPETKRLMINEKEAEVVRAIFDFYANGIILDNGKRKLVQFRALATYLGRIGIKTPRGNNEWGAMQVRQLLESERYIGTIRYNTRQTLADGTRVPRPESEHIIVHDAHPPIIDNETWERVQDRINNRDIPTNTKLDFEPNRLAGLCVCKKCGRKFVRRSAVQRYKKRDGSISVYDKTMLFCGTTGCTYVRYNAIEDDIIETLSSLSKLDSASLSSQLERIMVKEKSTETEYDLEKHVQSKREELKRRMKFVQGKHETGVYSDEIFLERISELEKELADLDKIQVKEKTDSQSDYIDPNYAKKNLNSAINAYAEATSDTDKNKVLHSVFSHINIEILKKGSGTRPAVHQIEPFLKSSFLLK